MIQKMPVAVLTFTAKGVDLREKIKISLDDRRIINATKDDLEMLFEKRYSIIFIGAAGIAVRLIAPFVKDKFTDSAVVVIDEKGQFVIPILSGHIGMANELAMELAEAMGATPVITTATDVNGVEAIDVFAVKNGYTIANRDGIRVVAEKRLNGIEPDIRIKHFGEPVEGDITLYPKEYVVGIGCKADTSSVALEAFFNEKLKEIGITPDQIYGIASIDRKKDETAILDLASKYGLKYYVFTADELNAVEGDFSESDFVKSQVGVGNVCERAAVLAAPKGGKIVLKKTARDGMTIAAVRFKFNNYTS